MQDGETVLIATLLAGRVREYRDARGAWSSALQKTPVTGPVLVTLAGLEGDEVQDRIHHGDADKALLCYSVAHYPRWLEDTGLELPPGAFGENLLLEGLDEQGACLGDVWSAGGARLQVSQPRMPCWKPARLWGRPTLVEEMSTTGRTGWYLRVLREGRLAAGAMLELEQRPQPDWSVARCWQTYLGRKSDAAEWVALRALPELAAAWQS